MLYANTSIVFRHSPDKNSPINFILFFFKANTAIFVVLSCKNNLIVYNIKYTYLSAFLSLVGMDSPTTLYVHCWTGGNESSLDAPSVFRFLCDKTKEISEVINFLGATSLHRFSRLFLMHNISSKLVNLFNSRYFRQMSSVPFVLFYCKIRS